MEGLYPQMSDAVIMAAKTISGFTDRAHMTEDKWDTYADAADALRENLQQLNTMLNVEYDFAEGIPADIVNYAAQLEQLHTPLAELAGYLLDRNEMFGGDAYKYETIFLTETLEAAAENARIITAMLTP